MLLVCGPHCEEHLFRSWERRVVRGPGSQGTSWKDERFCCNWSFLPPVRGGNSNSISLDIWGLISVCWSVRLEARGCPVLCKMFAASLASAHWMLGSTISPSTPCLWQQKHFQTLPSVPCCSIVSNSLQPCGLQHARLLCAPLSLGVCSCPLSQ